MREITKSSDTYSWSSAVFAPSGVVGWPSVVDWPSEGGVDWPGSRLHWWFDLKRSSSEMLSLEVGVGVGVSAPSPNDNPCIFSNYYYNY